MSERPTMEEMRRRVQFLERARDADWMLRLGECRCCGDDFEPWEDDANGDYCGECRTGGCNE